MIDEGMEYWNIAFITLIEKEKIIASTKLIQKEKCVEKENCTGIENIIK